MVISVALNRNRVNPVKMFREEKRHCRGQRAIITDVNFKKYYLV